MIVSQGMLTTRRQVDHREVWRFGEATASASEIRWQKRLSFKVLRHGGCHRIGLRRERFSSPERRGSSQAPCPAHLRVARHGDRR
jgi:hypothetical protein